MKKIVLFLIFVILLSSFAFCALPGKFGGEASNLIIGDPLNVVTAGKGMFFYQFTEDLSAGIGIINANNAKTTGSSDTQLGVQLKGQWNLGRGNATPYLALELAYVSADVPNGAWYEKYSLFNMALLYGVEVMWLQDISIIADVRLIECGSFNGTDLWGNQESKNDIALFSGTTLGIRWYIL